MEQFSDTRATMLGKSTSAKDTPCRGRVERDEGPFSPSRRAASAEHRFVADEDATNLEDF
jgi:hypothetical protein